METKLKGNIHSICLVTLFLIGNALINLPLQKYVSSSLPGFIIAVIIAVPFMYFCSSLIRKANANVSGFYSKFTFFLLALYSAFCGLTSIRNYITFSDIVILPEANSFFPVIIFILITAFLSTRRKEVIIKLCLVFTLFISLAIVFLFISGIGNMRLSNLFNVNFSLKGILYQCFSFLAISFLEGIVLVAFFTSLNKSKKVFLTGTLFAFLLLFIALIQTVSVFGYSVMESQRFPFADTMSVIYFGDKYTRLEGFSYFIYFACSLIKTSVCVRVFTDYTGKVFPKIKKYALPVILFVYLIFCVFVSFFKNLDFIVVAPFLLLPPFIIMLLLRRIH